MEWPFFRLLFVRSSFLSFPLSFYSVVVIGRRCFLWRSVACVVLSIMDEFGGGRSLKLSFAIGETRGGGFMAV